MKVAEAKDEEDQVHKVYELKLVGGIAAIRVRCSLCLLIIPLSQATCVNLNLPEDAIQKLMLMADTATKEEITAKVGMTFA